MNKHDLTLLSKGQVSGGNIFENILEVLDKYGKKAAVTDLCILTGCSVAQEYYVYEDRSLRGRTGSYWTKDFSSGDNIIFINSIGNVDKEFKAKRNIAIRPVLQSSEKFSQIDLNIVEGFNGTQEVEYGEYPQYAVDLKTQNILERKFNEGGMVETGKKYTFDSTKSDEQVPEFKEVNYIEYASGGKKYIRIKANLYRTLNGIILSNGVEYRDGDYVWIEVSPVKWLIDLKTKTLISKAGLVSGIRFSGFREKIYFFEETELQEYLDKYMFKNLFEKSIFSLYTTLENQNTNDAISEKQNTMEQKMGEKRRNPYELNLEKVSEEEIIKGAIESDVAVFLHGQSSEGKSARIKQIDPTCEIIYLCSATPESLNGKSVYNGLTGEMIDIKPSWLKKLEEKCEKEPDRYHIVFFDEMTNAFPSIQSIAFNIVLNKEVDGKWKLPENARIAAAGNDVEDSLAANQLAKPLFNRFAHVYIYTTTEKWLKWASENNIHPAIYSYIAFSHGEVLRSMYDGKKPNADPRKWEMASKMLYATGKPEMLRALIGEELTREFVHFCNRKVITLEDVINDNYTEREIECLSTAERYATTTGLCLVNDEALEKVRRFVFELGAEFVAIFDTLWTHGDESRLERLAELKLAESQIGGMGK